MGHSGFRWAVGELQRAILVSGGAVGEPQWAILVFRWAVGELQRAILVSDGPLENFNGPLWFPEGPLESSNGAFGFCRRGSRKPGPEDLTPFLAQEGYDLLVRNRPRRLQTPARKATASSTPASFAIAK
jgi:hypothetical protein